MADIAVLPTSKTQGDQFERTHVRKIYDEIATSVNDIEHKAWPKVKRFLKKFETGSLIADIGCGNGRYLGINEGVYMLGLDVCCALVDSSKQKGYEVGYADNLHLPLRDGLCDGVVSIGVIHHFCSVERRIKAIEELSRILKPGGKAMLYVWAYEQKHRKFDSQDVLVPWNDGSWNNKRPGSTSSRHSSTGAMSSTSSVSEDDSMDFSKDEVDVIPQNASVLNRRNSISLDDLSTVTELSNFTPSYYSLDFTGSPAKSGKVVNGKESQDGKHAIVTECRKLEESMRAMSADSLEELRTKLSAQRHVPGKSSLGHFSLESLEATKHDQPNDSFLHNDENGISFFEEEMLEAELLTFSQDIKFLHIDKPQSIRPLGRRKNSRERINRCAKVNPFMKQDSLEGYTFNNVSVSSDESDSLEDIMEVESENTTQDEVFVKFKPEKSEQPDTKNLEKEKSFFSTLKTKLLKLFDEDEKGKDIRTNSDSCEKGSIKDNNKLKGSANLTQEQQDLADKLNFKVREFPQSSCPEILSKEFYDNGFSQCTDLQYNLQYDNDRQANNQNSKCSSNSVPVDSFHRTSQDIYNRDLKNDPSKLYEQGKEKMHECSLKNQYKKQDSQISVEEIIYDGFIKIDIDNVKNGESKTCKGALNSNHKAKEDNTTKKWDKKTLKNNEDNFKQNLKCLSADPHNDTQNAKHRHEGCISIPMENNCHVIGDTEHIITENKKNIQISVSVECEQLDSEKSIDMVNPDVMNDSGIAVKESITTDESTKGKLCRYYHVFKEGELEALITSHIPNLRVIHGFYDHANWCVVAEKC